MDLPAFFSAHPRAALAFSGGVDSAFLLWAAKAYGCDVRPYYVHSVFQPAFERRDAERLAAEVGVPLTILEADVLAQPQVAANPADRCYHCKNILFSLLWAAARRDGCPVLLDGTNASDDAGDRPGMKVLRELEVLSPLRLCALTKDEVRRQSRAAGLFTWDKPAYACLATRVATGETITADVLARVEGAENALFALGFSDVRCRVFHGAARLQLPATQLERVLARRQEINAAVGVFFTPVLLDLEGR